LPYGQGIWPAFWELGYNIGSVGWPACGEQDIMENIGNSNWWGTNQASLHGPGYSGGNSLHAQYYLPSGEYFYQGYHKFAELWTPTSITFFVDDIPYETRTPADANGNAWAFTGPAFMIANLAVGGNFPGNPDGTTTFPQKMLVDYVKVYTTPFNGPHYIPGVVQVEDFDNGAQGIAYSTTTNSNVGGQYRPELGVGIENATGGGYDVGWTGAGQWMKYTVNVQSTGSYKVVVSAASNNAGGGSFHLEDEAGNNLTGTITVPNTGGWQNWTTINASAQLSAGTHIFKLVEDTGGYNLDYVAFTSTSGTFDGVHNLPGVVQSEDYNQGGEGVGFHSSTTASNPAGVYRGDPITVENCAAGGYDVSSTSAGQWLKYGVNAQVSGLYNIAFHVASGGTGGTFHILDEKGNNLTGAVTVPGTGGGQNWTFVNAIVNLAAGAHTLQLVEDTGGYSLDYMAFTIANNGSHYVPSTIAIADYDQGGEGIGYHTMAPFSPTQNSYRTSDSVGIESSSLGGNDVGWTQAGQWLRYTVFANYAGQYTATFTVASGANGGSFHLEDESGNNLTGAVNVPATGGWQTWQTVSANVTLAAGGQVLRLVEDSGGFNLYSMQFSLSSTPAASGISLSPTSVTMGQSSSATVTLNAPAVPSIGPDGQMVLAGQAALVASDNAGATIGSGTSTFQFGGASYVLVGTGQSSAGFTVNTTSVSSTVKANISATLGGSVSAPLTINFVGRPPLAPTGLTATPG
jgi:beta-glucanase (GH16 family)